MGSRRTHECGRGGQRAGRLHRRLRVHLEPAGAGSATACRARHRAHAFTLVHDSERRRLRSPARRRSARAPRCWWTPTTWPRAVRTAVEVAGPDLGAVRIDSGDLPVLARQVRALLDALGATSTRIMLTGDLDEYSIAALAAAPVDGYGVGTSLVTGSGAPTAALVYKLVARSGEPVADGAPSIRRAAAGGQALGGQAGAGRAQVGGAAPRRRTAPRLSERVSLHPARRRAAGPRAAGAAGRATARSWGARPSPAARARHRAGAGRAAAVRAAAVPRLPRHPHHLRSGRHRRLSTRKVTGHAWLASGNRYHVVNNVH